MSVNATSGTFLQNTDLPVESNCEDNMISIGMESSEEYIPPLDVEPDRAYKSIDSLLTGQRIFNLGHVLKQYELIIKHPTNCTMVRMNFEKEIRKGLVSILHFYCNNCETRIVICTDSAISCDNDKLKTLEKTKVLI